MTAAAFTGLGPRRPDALLALIAMHRADMRPDKIDVGVGVYRDETGQTPVMRAVKAAEARLVTEQPSKSYLGGDGDARFTELLAGMVFGGGKKESRRFGLQTPGGTGALRLGAALLAQANTGTRVWIGDPTWPNHGPIFTDAGLETIVHPYLDATGGGIAFDAMIEALWNARAGDAILLHGCCHNPTGTQFTGDEWRALATLCNTRGLIPFLDIAYQGLGDGIEEDVAGARHLIETVPATVVAYSCNKNFGVYRDRVGALWVHAPTTATIDLVRANLLALSRSLWSMPPDHGAAVVRTILDDPSLAQDWRDELAGMRTRINAVRIALAGLHPALRPIARQRGMFSRLPIGNDAVDAMRATHGIYMPGDSRINIAGLNDRNIARFADGLLPHLSGHGAGNMIETARAGGTLS